MKISIVIPAKNEEENVAPVVTEIYKALDDIHDFEIIYVDDGSTDGTYQRLCELKRGDYGRLSVIKHKYSVGQSTAIWTGVKHANGELVVTLDADGQNDPADIPTLVERALAMPIGSDFCIAGNRKNRKDTTWKRVQSRIANRIRSNILGDNTPDTGCGLKVLPKQTFLALPYFDHMHRFIPALVSRLGGVVEVNDVNHRDRQYGQSKYNMLGRLGVGIVDIVGVLWLQKRCKIKDIVVVVER
ncbi:Dodecaprenyl-phosphate galacturonate synthase [Paraglaciecola mesophila]|uniref:Dodecaprenyl-phosphate galacturonate synthase n=1 Tax=Paraglaciecola mesophila TaxID=197222 RepID=A0A857JJB5_9ALTE|nr:glycosyltransferase family 2 protein [Paraglaciecola mesophila]QHJ11338.1 Dodecaprenyl-phosphate galacturonate synthase [Paraglaciecola mesophila]